MKYWLDFKKVERQRAGFFYAIQMRTARYEECLRAAAGMFLAAGIYD